MVVDTGAETGNRATAVVDTAASLLAMAPARPAGHLAQALHERRDQAVWIYVIVAVAVITAAGGVLAWAYAYCVSRGGSFDGGMSASWNPTEVELRFKCTQ